MTLNEITAELKRGGIENANGEALILLSHFTGMNTASLLCDRNKSHIISGLNEAVRRRCSREPLQYIIGEWEFMGLKFHLTEACLIPRSDTELLAEFSVNRLKNGGAFLDLCTGSGCIAVSVAVLRPDAEITAVDKYLDTLDAAIYNARANTDLNTSKEINFICGDVTFDLFPDRGEIFDFIASNPPYVSVDEMEKLEPELRFEPRHALTDEGDGLSIIRKIIEIYPSHLKKGGIMAIEHGSMQGEQVRNIMEYYGYFPETIRDAGGNERVTYFTK